MTSLMLMPPNNQGKHMKRNKNKDQGIETKKIGVSDSVLELNVDLIAGPKEVDTAKLFGNKSVAELEII